MKKSAARMCGVVFIGLAVAASFALCRRPLQRWAFAQSIVRKDGPDEAQLDQVIGEQASPVEGLLLLWSSGRMPHRHRVMHFIQEHQNVTHDHWAQLRPLVIDAVASRDTDLAEPGMAALCLNDAETAGAAAISLLNDADPEMRIVGIRTIQQLHSSRGYPGLVDALADPESGVQERAKLALALCVKPETQIDLHDPHSIEQAMRTLHAAMSSSNPLTQPALATFESHTTEITAPDFTAMDLDHHPVRLADLRGKTVLLNFWATWCGPCKSELPDLAALQKAHPNDLKIIGISVDAVRDDDGDGGASIEKSLPGIRKVLAEKKVTYTDVIDTRGAIVSDYNGSGVPLNVIIDANGIVRRRYVGARSLAAMEKMIASLADLRR